MSRARTVFVFAVAGAGLGCILATLLAPSLLSWYLSPGSAGGALCPCQELVQQTTGKFMRVQIYGMGIGLVTGIALGIPFSRWWARKTGVAAA